MKRVFVYSVIIAWVACSEKKLTHTENSKIVAENFYHNDEAILKKYATAESYFNLSSIQELFAGNKNSEVNFQFIKDHH